MEQDGRVKGGLKRAESLTPERRKEIAQMGVKARRLRLADREELEKLPRATHEGELTIGDAVIPCAVLADGTRLLTQQGFLRALGRSSKPKGRSQQVAEQVADGLPPFLSTASLKPLITPEIIVATVPVPFRTLAGAKALGYRADLLPKVCNLFLEADDRDLLTKQQADLAVKCQVLIRGLAEVGITALVDEATGFQYERPRRDLEEQLKKYLADSLRRWARTFPASYFEHLCRLRGVDLRPDMKLPLYFGHLTNNLVYRRIAPGLLAKLKERRAEKGSPSNKLAQWLSLDLGVPELLVHLGTVIGVMKQHTNYDEFERALNDIAPIYPEHPGLFDNPKDWEPRG